MSKAISRVLIGVVLFAQFAVASYACPSLMGAASMAAATSPEATQVATTTGMPPGCDQLDPDAANLCAEHCRQGQQSADTASAPVVSLGIPTFLYSLPIEPQHSLGPGRSFPAPDAHLDAAPEPPHAILHCVFRI
ncbi:MAG: hypothetical protein ABI887_00015 [Burkholderiales bacterium]